MTHIIDRTTINLTGHFVSSKDLPELDFSLAGFETVIDHVRDHLPRNAKPFESVDSSGLRTTVVLK